jgi:hypothetical protein
MREFANMLLGGIVARKHRRNKKQKEDGGENPDS